MRFSAAFALQVASLLLVAECGKSDPPVPPRPVVSRPPLVKKTAAVEPREPVGPPASPENPQVIRGNLFEDYHYAFTLRKPSQAWQFRAEEKARRLNPDAVMAVFNASTKGFFAVVPERIADSTLEKYVDLFFTNPVLAQAEAGERRNLQVDGRPAVQFEMKARTQGLEFSYFITLIRNGNFYYQLWGWSHASRFNDCRAGLKAIAGTIDFAEDRKPLIRAPQSVLEALGVDWRISKGIYSNASYGFRLVPPDGWRLMERTELETSAPDAAAGLVYPDPVIYQNYVVETVGSVDEEEFIRSLLKNLESELGLEGRKPEISPKEIAGEKAVERLYRRTDLVGAAPYDFCVLSFFRKGLFFRVQTWWQSSQSEEGLRAARKSYAALEWLDDASRRRLEDELLRHDGNNRVGRQFSVRKGLFRDFRFGFTFKAPSGLWHIHAGEDLKAQYPDARAVFSHAGEGVTVLLSPELIDMSHDEYHRTLLRNMSAKDPETRDIERRGSTLRLSTFSATIGDFAMTYALLTGTQGRKHIQASASALLSNRKNLEARIDEIIDGLEVSPASLRSIERSARRIRDNRLGYQVEHDGTWTVQIPKAFKGLEAVSSMMILTSKKTICLVMAICMTTGFDEELAIQAMVSGAGLNVDPRTRKERRSTLAGLPANEYSMDGRWLQQSSSIKVWLAGRANTTYMFLASVPRGTFTPGAEKRVKSMLSLLD